MQSMNKKTCLFNSINTNIVFIKLPNILALLDKENKYRNRKNLLDCIENLHCHAKNHKKICIDFSSTKYAFSEAMLLFYAELHNLKNIYPNIKLSCKKSHEMRINHVLLQLGLFSFFKKSYKKLKCYDNVDKWKTSSGKYAIENNYKDIRPRDNLLNKSTSEDLYAACNEATINSVNHAYIIERTLSKVDFEKEAWWGFSEETKDYFSVSICDLGVGIPATIPKTNKALWEKFKELFDKEDHAEIMNRAIERPESRTKETHRGNGLKTIANFAKNNNNIFLTILSYKGIIKIENNNVTKNNCNKAMQGTIISWKIMKNGVTENEK